MEIANKKIALLIDSENISPKYIKLIVDELNQYGKILIKRIYGDFTSNISSSWREPVLEYVLSPIQQFTYTKGKNATDSALIIDAMEILYSNKVDSFCLMTSDSDFTRLAIKLQEEGMTVFGAGENKTPKSFVQVCDRFIILDAVKTYDKEFEEIKNNNDHPPINLPNIEDIISILKEIIEANADAGGGWAYFANVMNELYNLHPEFNPKYYGKKKKLIPFFKERGFEFETRTSTKHNDSTLIRYKK